MVSKKFVKFIKIFILPLKHFVDETKTAYRLTTAKLFVFPCAFAAICIFIIIIIIIISLSHTHVFWL